MQSNHRSEEAVRDADKDYPEPSSKAPVFCVWRGGFQETGGELVLEVEIRPRANGRAPCSGCGCAASGYDTLARRRFEFVPLWDIKVFFVYAPRRVACPGCGVRVELMPWAQGNRHLTRSYAWFLAGWAKRLSWKEVAEAFRTSWENVFRSVETAVDWGRRHQDLSGIGPLGIDEIHQWRRGHQYLTLWCPRSTRTKAPAAGGQGPQGEDPAAFPLAWQRAKRGLAVHLLRASGRPYLKVVAKKAGPAIHVLDRFHVMAHMSKAIDEVRAGEAKDLKAKGLQPVLKNTRWLLLKRPENPTEKQEIKLADLLRFNLKAVRVYLLKEDFQFFWGYRSPYWAGRFLDRWCRRSMRSRIDPMKKVARMLRGHRALLLNWFRAKGQLSGGVVEGFNKKAKLTTRKAFGFRTYHAVDIALYHTLGALPEAQFTHRIC